MVYTYTKHEVSAMNLKQIKSYIYNFQPDFWLVVFMIPIAILLAVLNTSIFSHGGQQFSELAQAFIHGQLNFLHPIGGYGQDPILYHGKIYWGEGPFPAILLVPFVYIFSLFHTFFYQNYLQWALIFGVLYFVFKIARHFKYSTVDSLMLMFGFALGTVFIGVAAVSSSWLFAQVVTTFLIFWAFYEYFFRKRWWLIGLICGLIVLTRLTASPILIFFALELWRSKVASHKLKNYLVFGLPIIVAGGLVGLYNYLRFHSPFNGGFEYQLIDQNSANARSMGVFSPVHIPTNLYSALLRGPIPVLRNSISWSLKYPYIQNNPYGMSIFINSSYLLFLFTQKWSDYKTRERNLIIAVLVSCLLVFSYYGVGANQFGYRYSLDFLPGLFILFMIMYRKKHEKITFGMKSLLIASGALNFYILLTFV